LYQNYARLRDERKMTDYEVSKKTGIPTSTLSNWKAGRYKPKADKIMKIAELFEVPMEDIMKEPAAVEG